jgi:hypothetical protein
VKPGDLVRWLGNPRNSLGIVIEPPNEASIVRVFFFDTLIPIEYLYINDLELVSRSAESPTM